MVSFSRSTRVFNRQQRSNVKKKRMGTDKLILSIKSVKKGSFASLWGKDPSISDLDISMFRL